MPDEKAVSAVAFLKAAVAYYESLGIAVERVMTDNGPCYTSKAFQAACESLGSSMCAPGPIRREPTERPNASSRRLCANGPMPKPIRHPATAPTNWRPGSTNTIGIGHMAG